jgi:glycosyltransferase involved in cell wall biosynthesis
MRACRDEGIAAWVLSLGRNRQRTTYKWYPATTARIDGVPVVFAAFWDCPLLTHVVTIVSVGLITWRLRKTVAAAVYWNASPHYVLALFMAHRCGMRCVLDLEDGLRDDIRGLRGAVQRYLLRLWDRSADAVMVANAQLLGQIKTRPAYLYYGVGQAIRIPRAWSRKLQVLFSGHLSKSTGVEILIDALLALKNTSPCTFSKLRVIAVGGGDLAGQLRAVADGDLRGILEFRGRVTDHEYQELLRTSHIGLCLKLPDHPFGQTTFPSKVIEFASWGLLVVSYKVSDVPTLFPDDGAILLENDTTHELGSALERIVELPSEAQRRAETGKSAVTRRLNPQSVAQDLALLWLGHALSNDVKSGRSKLADRTRVDVDECG